MTVEVGSTHRFEMGCIHKVNLAVVVATIETGGVSFLDGSSMGNCIGLGAHLIRLIYLVAALSKPGLILFAASVDQCTHTSANREQD